MTKNVRKLHRPFVVHFETGFALRQMTTKLFAAVDFHLQFALESDILLTNLTLLLRILRHLLFVWQTQTTTTSILRMHTISTFWALYGVITSPTMMQWHKQHCTTQYQREEDVPLDTSCEAATSANETSQPGLRTEATRWQKEKWKTKDDMAKRHTERPGDDGHRLERQDNCCQQWCQLETYCWPMFHMEQEEQSLSKTVWKHWSILLRVISSFHRTSVFSKSEVPTRIHNIRHWHSH